MPRTEEIVTLLKTIGYELPDAHSIRSINGFDCYEINLGLTITIWANFHLMIYYYAHNHDAYAHSDFIRKNGPFWFYKHEGEEEESWELFSPDIEKAYQEWKLKTIKKYDS